MAGAGEVSGRRNPSQSGCDDDCTGVRCNPCLVNSKSSNAVHYCVQCDEFLCVNCAEAHRGLRAFKKHVLLGRDEMPRKRLTEGNFCTEHDHKLFEIHCQSHDKLCCTDCLISSHMGCTVEKVKDIADTFNKSQEYLTLNQKIAHLQNQLKLIEIESREILDDLETCYNKLLYDIKDFRDDINQILDSLESSIRKVAETLKQADDKSVNSVLSASKHITSELKTISTSLQKQEEYNLNHHLVLTSKKAQSQVIQFEARVAELEKANTAGDYVFSRDYVLVEVLPSVTRFGKVIDKKAVGRQNQPNIQNYSHGQTHQNAAVSDGIVYQSQAQARLSEGAQKGTNMYKGDGNPISDGDQVQGAMNEDSVTSNLDFYGYPMSGPTDGVVKATRNLEMNPPRTNNDTRPKTANIPNIGSTAISSRKVRDIPIKHEYDKEDCWITGTAKLGEDMLVAADHRNKSLKVVYLPVDTITDYLDVSAYGTPWDVTCVNPNKLVATCGSKVLCLSATRGRLQIVTTLNLNAEARGISYNDNVLYISCISPYPSVKVVTMQGFNLKPTKIDNYGNQLFKEPCYITHSNDKSALIVSDKGNNSVNRFSKDGSHSQCFRNRKLIHPGGLAVDGANNVYTAGCKSHNIYVYRITPGGKPKGTVLQGDDSAFGPQSITWFPRQNQLCISHCYGNTSMTNYLSVVQV